MNRLWILIFFIFELSLSVWAVDPLFGIRVQGGMLSNRDFSAKTIGAYCDVQTGFLPIWVTLGADFCLPDTAKIPRLTVQRMMVSTRFKLGLPMCIGAGVFRSYMIDDGFNADDKRGEFLQWMVLVPRGNHSYFLELNSTDTIVTLPGSVSEGAVMGGNLGCGWYF